MRKKRRKADLVLRFFQGSKKYFLVAVLASLVTTAVEDSGQIPGGNTYAVVLHI